MKTLQDFKDIVANLHPNWTQKKINAEANIRFNAQIAANNNSNTNEGDIPDTSTDVKLERFKLVKELTGMLLQMGRLFVFRHQQRLVLQPKRLLDRQYQVQQHNQYLLHLCKMVKALNLKT
jgi:hypothetical protein